MEEYFYIDAAGQQKGPITPNNFMPLGLTADTLIWKNGMTDWQAAGTLPELTSYLHPIPVPPPLPTPPPLAYAPPRPAGKKPANYLIWSLLNLAFCCLPLGFVALHYSLKVDKLWEKGATLEAIKAAGNAKLYCLLSVIFGLVSQFFLGFSGVITILVNILIRALVLKI